MQSTNFFPEFNIRLYDKNSESRFFFFPPSKSEYFFSNVGNQNIFLEKNHNPPSQFPLPMALNSVFSFIKMSDRDLKFVYLFCQTDMFLFVIETPIHMYVNVNILLVGTSTCKTWNIKTEIYYRAQK